MTQGTCPVCGEAFETNPVGRPRIYCSSRCRDQRVNRRAARPTECAECGGLLEQQTMGAPRIYCSVACVTRAGSRRSRRRIVPAVVPDRACQECGTVYKPKRAGSVYCSRDCYRRGNAKRPKFTPEHRTCDDCGMSYVARRYDARFCSLACAKRLHGRERQNKQRTGRQALYSDREIFERDGWMCWLCNEPVDPSLSRKDRRGATIDHVIPLSRGGSDEADNVRLAHWGCNHEKHTRIVA